MPKQKQVLFTEDSDEEVTFKIENEYAKKYDTWRGKEEIHKLEQKYAHNGSSDSEDDSDELPEVSEEMETQFLKTLSMLKTKDPRIYDPKHEFFEATMVKEEEKPQKTKTLTFDDSDDDDDNDGNIFTIEKKAEIDTDKRDDISQLGYAINTEHNLKDYLTGKSMHAGGDVEQDLAPLKALWSDPKLNEGEAFLRDYILNKRYLDDGDTGGAEDRLRDDEDLEEDSKRVEEQGKFERAYNFRFEEPDDEYLKRYPRTVSSTRPRDDRRARRREEVRVRKSAEKQRKMDDIARLKALKLQEIREQIDRIKQVTGNQELAFKEEDLEGDWDPAEHDRRMRTLFDDQYYGGEEMEKPVFPELDEELEIENWDKFDTSAERGKQQEGEEFHCEDEDFNMDADYNPKQARNNLLEELKQNLGMKRRNRKKKSKLAALLATEKPKYIPENEKTYDQHMEEYYQMDCEDIIGGDLPTRFKYKEVVPNDYGLTIEEIMLADDRELTQWVPLKRVLRTRDDRGDVAAYRARARDDKLKRKLLPSLFNHLPQEPELVVPVEEVTKKKKKKKSKRKNEEGGDTTDIVEENNSVAENDILVDNDDVKNSDDIETSSETKHKRKKRKQVEDSNDETSEVSPKKKKKRKNTIEANNNTEGNVDEMKQNIDIVREKSKKTKENGIMAHANEVRDKNKKEGRVKKMSGDFIVEDVTEIAGPSHNINTESSMSSKKKKKKKQKEQNMEDKDGKRKADATSEVINKKTKNDVKHNKVNLKNKFKQKGKFNNKTMSNKSQTSDNPLNSISDERLKAYGLNPKKYRSFLKYKKF